MGSQEINLTPAERSLVLAMRAFGKMRARRVQLMLTPVPGEVPSSEQRYMAWLERPARVRVDAEGVEIEVAPPVTKVATSVDPVVAVTDAIRAMVEVCR